MQVDEDARVALLEMNTLREEHRCVAVRIQGKDSVVQSFGHLEIRSLLHQPAEQRESAFQPFGMPLHT